MHDIIFTAVKLVVMILALIVSRYLVPWLKTHVQTNTLEAAANWAVQAVLFAQQVMKSSSGEEKKETVASFLEQIFKQRGLKISSEELDILIESAVKEMKMETIIPESEGE